MAKSSLCTYTNITGNRSRGRGGQRVCKITPHYMAAKWTGKQCADHFAGTNRQASSNYCIGTGGDIAMSVDEADRAWTSSSAWNDNRAITIECANNPDSSLTDATWNSLVNLCVDICRRYGFRLTYDGTRNGSLTEHRMFAATSCPGEWLHARMGQLAAEVNARLDGGTVAPSTPAAPSAPTTGATSGTGFGGTYTCTVDSLNVRNAPSLSGSVVAKYGKGQTVVLDDWYTKADGYIWGRYTGASSGQKRYVAVGKATGKPEPDDYLVKGGSGSSASSGGSVSSAVAAGTYRIVADALNVRTSPSTGAGIAAQYKKGQTVVLDGWSTVANGCVWGRYVGASSGKYRYIAVRTTGGATYATRV